jgi:hypothetical protein
MTGPEHYKQAEQLLGDIARADGIIVIANPHALAAAQVHATLALAAATIAVTWLNPADRHEWQKAIDPEYDAAVAAARAAATDPAGPGWAEVTR